MQYNVDNIIVTKVMVWSDSSLPIHVQLKSYAMHIVYYYYRAYSDIKGLSSRLRGWIDLWLYP